MATTVYLETYAGPFAPGFVSDGVAYLEGDPFDSAFYPWPYPCPAPPTPHTDPPVVTFVSPLPGTTIQTEDTLVVDVTDVTAGLRIVLLALAAEGDDRVELVHDGASFMPRYVGRSYREAITDGWRYYLKRVGGWPAGVDVTLRVWAVDTYGNAA